MTLKTLGAPMTSAREAPNALALMGQDLFNPPNVKGWNEGRDWINSRTLLARVNFASRLAEEMNRRVSLLDTLRGLDSSANSSAPRSSMSGGSTMMAMSEPPTMMGGASMSSTMSGASMNSMSASMNTMNGAAMNPKMTAAQSDAKARSAVAAPDEAIDLLWNALFRGMEMPASTRALLLKYATGDKPDIKQLPTGKVQGLINLMVSLPEYQLC